jgi:hypothetical protein
MVKCNVCGGTYEPTQSDGSQYFHSCPPLSGAEIRDQLQKKTLQLRAADQKRLDDATAADKSDPVKEGERPRADVVLDTLAIERPNKRDENVVGVGAPGQPALQKAPGIGVTKL